jgi:putative transposase
LDVKKRYTEEQIIGFLKEADGGVPVKELCNDEMDTPSQPPR